MCVKRLLTFADFLQSANARKTDSICHDNSDRRTCTCLSTIDVSRLNVDIDNMSVLFIGIVMFSCL